MHAARPQAALVPCPVCGTQVDALRAPHAIAFERGIRVVCSDACAVALRRAAPVTPPAAEDDSLPIPYTQRESEEALRLMASSPGQLTAPVAPVPVPWMVFGLVFINVVLSALAAHGWARALATAGIAGTIALALRMHRRAITEAGWAPYLVGPGAAAVALLSAVLTDSAASPAWAFVSAAGVAGVVVARAWLDERAGAPVRALLEQLTAVLPEPTITQLEGLSANASYDLMHGVDRGRRGESVLAKNGDVLAVDGVVQAGTALVFLHPSDLVPATRTVGQPVIAGARVHEGQLRILTTAVGDDRALRRPHRIRDADDDSRAGSVRIGRQFADWGSLFALAVALSGFFLAGGGFAAQLSAVATVLIAAPLLTVRRAAEYVMTCASATAARRGIFFRDAQTLEAAGGVLTAAVCARGSVTMGVLEVANVRPLADDTEASILAVAYGAEMAATGHPIATAVQAYAEKNGIAPDALRRPVLQPGRGITGTTASGEPAAIGNRPLLLDNGVSIAVADAEAKVAETRGHTVLFVGIGGRVRGIIALRDTLRPGARAAIQRIFDMGAEVVLLSGDHRGSVEILAKHLDVENVRAELTPEDRGAEVTRLRESGGAVAAIGHAGPDDACLAAADVAVMLGAAGSLDGARQGTIALTSDDLRDAATALWIARAARSMARRTVFAGVAVGSALMALSAVQLMPLLVSAIATLVLDAYALPAGARLLERFALRVPESS